MDYFVNEVIQSDPSGGSLALSSPWSSFFSSCHSLPNGGDSEHWEGLAPRQAFCLDFPRSCYILSPAAGYVCHSEVMVSDAGLTISYLFL